jgi:hypothetical protein
MEHVFVSALALSYDPVILDNVRWVVGEFADEVLIARSWSEAMGIARSRHILVAVVDFDNIPAHTLPMLVTALRMRAHATIIAVGTKDSNENAAALGVTMLAGKPLNMPSLLEEIVRIVGGTHGHGKTV